MKSMEANKMIDLFGEEHHVFKKPNKRQKSLFHDYDGFVDKFKPKLTTDDCYTPPAVYDCIVEYVSKNCDIDGCPIIRPFYPGGDYENLMYPPDCVIIDNPPFSIVSKIAHFYIERGILFFLFAPHLTLFSSDLNCTRIVCSASIIYENGANVKTSFLSNMFGDLGILADPALHDAIQRICNKPKANLPKYEYPANLLTVSKIANMVSNGQAFYAMKKDLHKCSRLDMQKQYGKAIFGGGFLCSAEAAEAAAEAAAAAAEAAAAEAAAAEAAAAEAAAAEVISWSLSEREKNIIKSLG